MQRGGAGVGGSALTVSNHSIGKYKVSDFAYISCHAVTWMACNIISNLFKTRYFSFFSDMGDSENIQLEQGT